MKNLVPELEFKRSSFQGFKRKTSYSGQYSDFKQRRHNELKIDNKFQCLKMTLCPAENDLFKDNV